MDPKKMSEFLPILFWLLGGILLCPMLTNAAPNPNFHIYIAYGQSNMAGNGDIVPAEDQATDPKNFLMLASHNANASQRSGKTTQSIKTGEWYPAIPPMFHPTENLSPADYFGRAMVDSLPGVTVGIIPVAIGAVAIKAFDKDQYKAYFSSAESYIQNWARDYDSNPYQRIVDLGKKAKEVGVIKGFIFHQGETDGSGTEWQNAVYKTYKDIVDALGLDENEVAFVAGELLQEGNNCCGGKNGGIAQLKSKFKKFGLASSKGLQGNGRDPYHFGRAGVIELGKRYCSEMLKLIDKTLDPNAPEVNLTDPTQSTVPDAPPEEYGPYGDAPISIPGTVEAENYNKGGAGKAYMDLSEGNEGGKFRKDDVDINQPNMGIAVGHNQKTEWLKYTVNVAADGEYEISALVSGENGTGSFVLYMDDVQIGSEIANEGKGFDNFTEVSGGKATLKAGEHELKLEITNDWIDIDYIKFTAVADSSANNDPPTKLVQPAYVSYATETESSFAIVDMQGRKLGVIKAASMAEAVEKTKEKMTQNKTSGGIYFVVSNTKNSRRLMQKVVVYER
ncbi:sialate O-acetylesterase [uncultured Fibrobacter sp.]|uniref:sialate O-acetylesterase n=1 Tax=uncultured Fibrobacter sp. TaxID=261512 RepID=UPI0025CD93F1|nr:sialate O-acetylesterase [uncultured Fibrobacter sp.]